MSDRNSPRKRSAVEAAAFQATKRARVITEADLISVAEGLAVESLMQASYSDYATVREAGL
ncbi:hypothetical protein [Rhodococcus globerulus]|uniref:hypothetical protein n=1 Tax=Rhodococcus globerulus TaxID=33008 RepID=UPI001F1FC3ED|nr:hypothetical protein [Rhodococcus globerulus]MCE4266148.1 hypothetical protein [Rhodococcus globerulus]